jgi:hypothetical protein
MGHYHFEKLIFIKYIVIKFKSRLKIMDSNLLVFFQCFLNTNYIQKSVYMLEILDLLTEVKDEMFLIFYFLLNLQTWP